MAKAVREVGNKLWKEGKTSEALDKWQSERHNVVYSSPILTITRSESVRYLDWHPEFARYTNDGKPFTEEPSAEPDSEVATRKLFTELLTPLLLNSALAALKLGGIENARTAKAVTDRALSEVSLSNADQGTIWSDLPHSTSMLMLFSAKALYRRALARVPLKEDEEAEADLIEANKLVKDDKAIIAELDRIQQVRQAYKAKQKAQFKKMFS